MDIGFTGLAGKVLARTPLTQTFQLPMFEEVKVQAKGPTEFFRTANLGAEPDFLATFSMLLHSTDTLWDVGSSVGLFSLIAAQQGCDAVAFEPDPSVADRLRNNCTLNSFGNKISIVQGALADKPGTLTLHSDGLNGMSGSLADLGLHAGNVEVEVHTIDDLIAAGTYKTPTVIKIDVEGAELSVLRGATALLASPDKPRAIFLEIHPAFLSQFNGTETEVRTLLADNGYSALADKKRNEQSVGIWMAN